MALREAQEAVKDAWQVGHWVGAGEFAETGNLQEVRWEGRQQEEPPRRITLLGGPEEIFMSGR